MKPDAMRIIKSSVGTLALREKRSGTKLVRDLAKCRRFSRALLEDFMILMAGYGVN